MQCHLQQSIESFSFAVIPVGLNDTITMAHLLFFTSSSKLHTHAHPRLCRQPIQTDRHVRRGWLGQTMTTHDRTVQDRIGQVRSRQVIRTGQVRQSSSGPRRSGGDTATVLEWLGRLGLTWAASEYPAERTTLGGVGK